MKAATALLVSVLAALRLAAGPQPESVVRVATLNPVLTEIAREVGGDAVRVDSLVGPGVDPHTFNPSPADVRILTDADLVLASGLSLEPYVGRLVSGAGLRGRVLEVGERVPLILTVPGTAERDPHWWHSIPNVSAAADLVRSELTALRPDHAAAFAERALRYQGRLRDLGRWAEAEVSKLPVSRRQLVTSHDAFAYLAHDLSFTVHPVNGLSTEDEASARHLVALVAFIRRESVRAIFVESGANARLVENLVEETGTRLGGRLVADGLGSPGSGADTYESMYRSNLRAIVDGLSGP